MSSRKQRSNGNPRRAPQKEPHREAISGSPGRDGSTWPFEDSGRRFEQIQNAEAQEGGRAGQDAERWIGKTGDSECKRRWEARLRGWCPGRPVGGINESGFKGWSVAPDWFLLAPPCSAWRVRLSPNHLSQMRNWAFHTNGG